MLLTTETLLPKKKRKNRRPSRAGWHAHDGAIYPEETVGLLFANGGRFLVVKVGDYGKISESRIKKGDRPCRMISRKCS